MRDFCEGCAQVGVGVYVSVRPDCPAENGSAKVCHGSGGIVLLLAE